jgi:hypothetical protein
MEPTAVGCAAPCDELARVNDPLPFFNRLERTSRLS